MEQFSKLAEYGSVGISIALIIVLYLIVKQVFTFMGNHIAHNTKAMQELIDAIKELKNYLMIKNGDKK